MTWVEIETKGKIEKAVNYNEMTGNLKIGDRLIVNTTAVELSLGTGGYHFVIHNKRNNERRLKGNGHIMKLRYTPLQLRCLAAEEQDSPHHEKIKSFSSLNNSVVIVGTLHSMLAPISAMIKWLRPDLKINYIMTDAGALPIDFSLTVKKLKDKNIVDNTITSGHSFGGDYECTNIYTSLITSKEVLNSDITIITMGPGIVGTGTKYGFSGIEQGYIVDAVNTLKGASFAVPRISFSDSRDRHNGISHHSITTLNEVIKTKTNLVLPKLKNDKMKYIKNQLSKTNIIKKHNVLYQDGNDVKKALDYYNLKVKTMGRNYEEDKEYFMALGAVAKGVVNYLKYHQ